MNRLNIQYRLSIGNFRESSSEGKRDEKKKSFVHELYGKSENRKARNVNCGLYNVANTLSLHGVSPRHSDAEETDSEQN